MTFKEYYLNREQDNVEFHYTLVMVTGDHSADHLVLRSFGEVPDEKVQSMVDYVMGIARDIAGEEGMEFEADGEYLDYVKAKMEHYSDVWQDVGIQRAVGEFEIADDVVILLKHFAPPKEIKAGDNNFPEQPSRVAAVPMMLKAWENVLVKEGWLDKLQAALDVIGFEPTVGTAADASNSVISALRSAAAIARRDGDTAKQHAIDAGISAISMIPFGDVAKIAKLRKFRKPAVKAARLAKDAGKGIQTRRRRQSAKQIASFGTAGITPATT